MNPSWVPRSVVVCVDYMATSRSRPRRHSASRTHKVFSAAPLLDIMSGESRVHLVGLTSTPRTQARRVRNDLFESSPEH
jgi:hypothetical protein